MRRNGATNHLILTTTKGTEDEEADHNARLAGGNGISYQCKVKR
jgi:hypothetical protein